MCEREGPGERPAPAPNASGQDDGQGIFAACEPTEDVSGARAIGQDERVWPRPLPLQASRAGRIDLVLHRLLSQVAAHRVGDAHGPLQERRIRLPAPVFTEQEQSQTTQRRVGR